MDAPHSEDGTGRKPISDKTMTGEDLTKMLQEAGVIPVDGITDRFMPRAEYALNNPKFFEPEHQDDWYDDLKDNAALITWVCVAAVLTLAGIWAILEAFA